MENRHTLFSSDEGWAVNTQASTELKKAVMLKSMHQLLFIVCSFLGISFAFAQNFHPIDDGSAPVKIEKTKPDESVKKPKMEDVDSAADTQIQPEKALPQPGVTISGVVRAVRGFPVTEVFFKDQKDSYFIDPTSSHDQIMNACLQSSRDGKSVSLRVDPTSRHVYSLSEQNKPAQDQGSDSSKMSRPGSN